MATPDAALPTSPTKRLSRQSLAVPNSSPAAPTPQQRTSVLVPNSTPGASSPQHRPSLAVRSSLTQQRPSIGVPGSSPTGSPSSSAHTPRGSASTPSSGGGTTTRQTITSGGSSSVIKAGGWTYATPKLTDLCYPVLAKNFAKFPGFGKLPPHERLRVVNEISVDLPLRLAAYVIPEEAYWKRRVQSKWRNCDTTAHGRSWKQLFFERNLAEALERFDPTVDQQSSLEEVMEISAPYVHSLDVMQLPAHVSFVLLFNVLKRECHGESYQRDLAGLRVKYGQADAGWNYNWNKWGMKRSDCLSLSSALSISATLTSLHLSGNRLDAEKIGILVKGLMANPTVVDLDLSCNFLADPGVKEVAKLLKASNSPLGMLSLANNHITAVGCRYLAECEDINKTFVSLNLRFNLFGDLGGKRIIDWANNNSKIQRLDIETCDIGEDSVQSFVRLMHNNHSALTSINMSGNHAIGVINGELLLAGLEAGKQMKELWISNCGCGEELEKKILTFLVERLFGRTCYHHPGKKESEEPTPQPQPEKEVVDVEKKEDATDEKKEETEDAQKMAKEGEEEEEEEEEVEETEEEKESREKAGKEAVEVEAVAAAEAAAKAAEAEKKAQEERENMIHIGHAHGAACTLECAHMVGLPPTHPPPEPVVYPEQYLAARDAQAAIKEIEDSKPYWGLEAIKDLKEKE